MFVAPRLEAKLQAFLEPYEGFMNLALIAIAAASIYVLFAFRDRPDLKAFYIAWVVLP